MNLISQGQIHRERLHQLSIVDDGICVGNKGMFARLIENNLYIMDIAGPSDFAFPSINEDTLKTWHARLGHLGRKNIIRLAKGMANGIDPIKHLPYSAYMPCSIGNLQAEPYRDKIEPGLESLDLVHSDVTGLFIEELYGTTHFVTFLCDSTKISEVILLTKKSGVLPAFKRYCLHYEKGDKRVRRLRTDEGGEYDSHDFTKFRDECGIIWEPIVPGNPEMNGSAERFGQTLHKMASTMLKDSGFELRYWPELVLTANYLQNSGPVVGRNFTPYEADIGHKPYLVHLRRIGQISLSQARNPHKGWRHWQNRAKRFRLIGYESHHIYCMVDAEGKIKQYSMVTWIDDDNNLRKRDQSHSSFPPAKWQQLIYSSANLSLEQPVEFSLQVPDDMLEENRQENDIPQDFLFEFTCNANDDPSPSKHRSSPLSSLRTTPDIPMPEIENGPPKSSDCSTSQGKPVTRSQTKPNTELFSLLASAKSPEIPESKNYKQATSKQNPHHDDWMADIREEIDSLIRNDT